ncbi:hypothetical protein XYCOK13_18320 [Xylanibacillus composti]|uniref:Uncharacterized protein n=1 Tax=Xylanibacillus composti TaxID=1572762 RepID=A0A8J4H5E4_9BACL|nr:hypothetical protein XYCOK13_18320 [Xylanibacillus composti]
MQYEIALRFLSRPRGSLKSDCESDLFVMTANNYGGEMRRSHLKGGEIYDARQYNNNSTDKEH